MASDPCGPSARAAFRPTLCVSPDPAGSGSDTLLVRGSVHRFRPTGGLPPTVSGRRLPGKTVRDVSALVHLPRPAGVFPLRLTGRRSSIVSSRLSPCRLDRLRPGRPPSGRATPPKRSCPEPSGSLPANRPEGPLPGGVRPVARVPPVFRPPSPSFPGDRTQGNRPENGREAKCVPSFRVPGRVFASLGAGRPPAAVARSTLPGASSGGRGHNYVARKGTGNGKTPRKPRPKPRPSRGFPAISAPNPKDRSRSGIRAGLSTRPSRSEVAPEAVETNVRRPVGDVKANGCRDFASRCRDFASHSRGNVQRSRGVEHVTRGTWHERRVSNPTSGPDLRPLTDL